MSSLWLFYLKASEAWARRLWMEKYDAISERVKIARLVVSH